VAAFPALHRGLRHVRPFRQLFLIPAMVIPELGDVPTDLVGKGVLPYARQNPKFPPPDPPQECGFFSSAISCPPAADQSPLRAEFPLEISGLKPHFERGKRNEKYD
jgi:hypothetical protein